MEDRWVWNLENSGEFSVAYIRRKIDDSRFPTIGDKTRWVKFVPIKINVFAWKVTVNALPTRYNLSRRVMDIQSLSCLMCDCGIESTDHVFFGCDVSRQIGCMISNWWNTPLVEMDTMAAWKTWFSSIRLLSLFCKTKSSSTSPNSLLEETNTFDNSLREFEIFCFDVEEISSGSTTISLDISLPEYEAFYDDHVKEINSGSPTTPSDISLSEYDS
nr:RNA-directed DNA polymerase, eukaryota [Tanacetum cinerariifolium]